MPGHSYPQTDRELLRRIERSAGQRAGYKQLVRELGLGGGRERRLLLEQLARMTARGALVKLDREQWALPSAAPEKTARVRSSSGDTSELTHRATRDRLVAGKIDLHRDGYAFVRPNDGAGREDDIFIPPSELNGAMQGDEVLVDEAPRGRDGRRSGRVARVLTRRNPTVVGIFHYARSHRQSPWENSVLRGNYVTPLDERMTQAILIPEGAEIVATPQATQHRVLGQEARQSFAWEPGAENSLEGLAVDVEITDFPTTGRPARGRVIEVLGPPDAFGVDVEIIIRKHHLPHVFPADVLVEAEDAALRSVATLSENERARRRDFRELPIVTIDGETARDFDDAVLVRPLANGNWELQVHIADVSHYVRPGTALDLEARLRGTSVYFPDRAVPMLPQQLSSNMCSLRPNEDRLVMSCVMEIDNRGEILGYELCEGMIRSVRRMTYTQVQAILDGDAAVSEDFLELVPEFRRMHELALKLNQKRHRRGSIDFDLPEPVVQFDPDGNMQAIVRSERGWSHRLIEEFMLSANECVAHWIEAQEIPSVYRVHEMPDPKRIVEFEETAAQFGQTLGLGNLPIRRMQMKSDRRETRGTGRAARIHEVPESIVVSPQMYQRLTAKIAGKPEERILAYLMLRSLKQAKYSENNVGHFALASPSYTHFTSPIRRYPDLIVHRLLRDLLHGGADPWGRAILSNEPQPWQQTATEHARPKPHDDGPLPEQELEAIAKESSEAERRADDAERELIEWKKIKFMQDRIGEDFDAIILSCTKYGFFVELDELFIEGLVPIATLADDRYVFRDTDRKIVGMKNGRVFSMGQKVRVLLDRIDRQQRRLQFALLPSEYDGGGGSKSSRRRKEAVDVDKPRQKNSKPKRKSKARLRKANLRNKRR